VQGLKGMALTISEHVHEVLTQMDKVQRLEGAERVNAVRSLHDLFRAIKRGDFILDPLCPREDRLTPIVENYRVKIRPDDVLDDPPDRFTYRWADTHGRL
jgi:hypothetical protein